MLYDPKWEIKTDPFSLDGLIAWLEKQPAAKTYCYMDTGGCLLHQYFTACGREVDGVGGTYIDFTDGTTWELSKSFAKVAQGKVGVTNRHTFGAALERARDALSRT